MSSKIELANSADTNYHFFQVKINCSRFIIDDFNNCSMTLLVPLFVTLRSLLFGVVLPRKSITFLRKITMNLG